MKLYKDNADRYCLADSLGDALELLQRVVAESEARHVAFMMQFPPGILPVSGHRSPTPVTSVELVAAHVYSDKAPTLSTGWPPVIGQQQ